MSKQTTTGSVVQGAAGKATEVIQPDSPWLATWLVTLNRIGTHTTHALYVRRDESRNAFELKIYEVEVEGGQPLPERPQAWRFTLPPKACLDLGDGSERVMERIARIATRSIVLGLLDVAIARLDEAYLVVLKEALRSS